MSHQSGQKIRKASTAYGMVPYGRNYMGDTKPTVPMFDYQCPACTYTELHTKKGVHYCSKQHTPKRMTLFKIGSKLVS